MDKLRSINTKIWSDPWFEDLETNFKIIFIYLLTNSKTNMLGIYESSIKKISFETGVEQKSVQKCLDKFREDGKVDYIQNYVVMINFLKNQKFNKNMKISAIDIHNELPKSLMINGLQIEKGDINEGFETLSNGFSMVPKIEIEKEREIEKEIETKTHPKKSDAPKKSDIVNSIIKIWCLKYKKSRDEDYDIAAIGKERSAAGKILQMNKKKNPTNDTEQALKNIGVLFELCLEIDDGWMYQNMTMPLIVSKFNEIKSILKNAKNKRNTKNNGASDAEIASILAETFTQKD